VQREVGVDIPPEQNRFFRAILLLDFVVPMQTVAPASSRALMNALAFDLKGSTRSSTEVLFFA
jgi:hypothetical protein